MNYVPINNSPAGQGQRGQEEGLGEPGGHVNTPNAGAFELGLSAATLPLLRPVVRDWEAGVLGARDSCFLQRFIGTRHKEQRRQ